MTRSRNRKSAPKAKHPVKAYFDQKKTNAAQEAYKKKFGIEDHRLAARERFTTIVFDAFLIEKHAQTGNGVGMSSERAIKIIERGMKQLCRDLGLESHEKN